MHELEPQPSTPEEPNPPELTRHTYDTLMRTATMYTMHAGSPLMLHGEDRFYIGTNERSHTNVQLLSNGEDHSSVLSHDDKGALFVGPEAMKGGLEGLVGVLAAHRLPNIDLPFESPTSKVELEVATFSEAAIPFMNPERKAEQLKGMPLVAIRLLFFEGHLKPTAGVQTRPLESEALNILLFPPGEEGDLSASVQLRFDTRHGFTNHMAAPGSTTFEAMQALTGHEYAWMNFDHPFEAQNGRHDFQKAARTRAKEAERLAEFGTASNSALWRSREHGYIGDHLPRGFIGEDGAEMLQRLIELAMHGGEPIEPVPAHVSA